jgi:shikimate 5-dehydrogenase
MFVEQAAAQFEIWTGEKAPRTIMRNAVAEALGA